MSSGGEIKDFRYSRYIICREMGWDYYTFMAQPVFFIEEISLIMYQEGQKEKREADRLNRQASRIRPKGI